MTSPSTFGTVGAPRGNQNRLGKTHTEETRRKISENRRGKGLGGSLQRQESLVAAWTPEMRARASTERRGTHLDGSEVRGTSTYRNGYRYLTGQHDHPLATSGGVVGEHRAALYTRIGPGPHPCHWRDLYGCGRTELEWGGRGGNSISADHLDHERLNNHPENMVPSCSSCNTKRARQHAKGLL